MSRCARYCGSEGQAGAYYRDEIRDIWGGFSTSDPGNDSGKPVGSFSEGGSTIVSYASGTGVLADNWVNFHAANTVPTGPEVVPQHYLQPIALYLGRSAEI